ncbi:MAG: 3'-5' exoribonuclease [Nocardiopsaceae bacterium]|nr:3'-5' exoribonuclease [Nocardiopsaceae bacterium]
MTLVCLDTEFLDDGRRIEPASLALVSETAEYYGICADSDITAITRHAWLRANVVPHLPIIVRGSDWQWDTAHPDFSHVKPRAQIAQEVRAFFTRLQAPEIWAYFSPFDTIVLSQLFGPMSDLPPEIPAFTLDLMQEARRHAGPLPAQRPPVHHALHDARHDLLIATTIGLTSQEARSPVSLVPRWD